MNPQLAQALDIDKIDPVEKQDSLASTTTGIRGGDYKTVSSISSPGAIIDPDRSTNAVIVIMSPSEGAERVREKRIYSVTSILGGRPHFIVIEGEPESLGEPGDTVALTRNWPAFWENPEDDDFRERGVFSPTYKKKILFSKNVEIHTASLPRLVPQFLIDRRSLSREDD